MANKKNKLKKKNISEVKKLRKNIAALRSRTKKGNWPAKIGTDKQRVVDAAAAAAADHLPPHQPSAEQPLDTDPTEELIIKEEIEDLADFGNDFDEESETPVDSKSRNVEEFPTTLTELSRESLSSLPSFLSQHPPPIKVITKQSQGKNLSLISLEPLTKKITPRPQRKRQMDATPVNTKQKQQKKITSTSCNGENSQLWSIAKCQEDILKILQKQAENRDDHFDNFSRYVASLLKALPKERAVALQPKIIELITAEHMRLDPGAGTSK